MLERMKLNVKIDPILHLEAKRYALEHGTTFSALLREALGEKLGLPKAAQPSTVPIAKDGLQPGVKLDDNAVTLERTEEGLESDSRR